MIAKKIFTGILLAASVCVLPACNSASNSNDNSSEADNNQSEEMTATATTMDATATLSPDQETEEVTSDGGGTFKGTFDETTGELTFTLEWSDLTGPPSMMHFHGPADPGADAGVKIPITDFPAEASGSVSNTVTVEGADRADLLAGKWYVNIHTESYGSGEIRGQVEFDAL